MGGQGLIARNVGMKFSLFIRLVCCVVTHDESRTWWAEGFWCISLCIWGEGSCL